MMNSDPTMIFAYCEYPPKGHLSLTASRMTGMESRGVKLRLVLLAKTPHMARSVTQRQHKTHGHMRVLRSVNLASLSRL